MPGRPAPATAVPLFRPRAAVARRSNPVAIDGREQRRSRDEPQHIVRTGRATVGRAMLLTAVAPPPAQRATRASSPWGGLRDARRPGFLRDGDRSGSASRGEGRTRRPGAGTRARRAHPLLTAGAATCCEARADHRMVTRATLITTGSSPRAPRGPRADGRRRSRDAHGGPTTAPGRPGTSGSNDGPASSRSPRHRRPRTEFRRSCRSSCP